MPEDKIKQENLGEDLRKDGDNGADSEAQFNVENFHQLKQQIGDITEPVAVEYGKLEAEHPETLAEFEDIKEKFDVFSEHGRKINKEIEDLEYQVGDIKLDLANDEVSSNFEIIDVGEEISSSPETTNNQPALENIDPYRFDELKEKLEEARQMYVEAKNKKEKTKYGAIGFLRGNSKKVDQVYFESAKEVYEKARAEYIGAEIVKILDEQLNLVEEQIKDNVKSKNILETSWEKVRTIYKKLGDLNLEKKFQTSSWLGKISARMVSARAAINTGLLGFGIATGGTAAVLTEAPRAIMRFVGMSGLTYDVLQNAARATEEKKGMLQDLGTEEIGKLEDGDLSNRMQTIEARAILDGNSLADSKYKKLYDRLGLELRRRMGEKNLEAEKKEEALNDFFIQAENALNEQMEKIKSERRRHRDYAVVAGTIAAAGWFGKAVSNTFGAFGMKETIQEYLVNDQSEPALPATPEIEASMEETKAVLNSAPKQVEHLAEETPKSTTANIIEKGYVKLKTGADGVSRVEFDEDKIIDEINKADVRGSLGQPPDSDLSDYISENVKPDDAQVKVETLKEVVKDKIMPPKGMEIANASIETQYQAMLNQVKNKIEAVLDIKTTVPFSLNQSGQSTNFVADVLEKIKNISVYDESGNKPTAISEIAKSKSVEDLYKIVEDKAFSILPKEADVLLAETNPGDGAVVLAGGSNAIKFVDPNAGTGYFTYDPEYTFLRDGAGQLIAKKGVMEYLIKPTFENGKLEVALDEIKVEK